jgi:hypothetical protein
MPAWLIPVSLFWSVAAVWVGGILEVKGGNGVRQILGLLVSYPLYLGLWWVVSTSLRGFAGALMGGVILPAVITSLTMPLVLGIGYRVLGMRLTRQQPAH